MPFKLSKKISAWGVCRIWMMSPGLVCNVIHDLNHLLICFQFVTTYGTGNCCRLHPERGLSSTDSVTLWKLKMDNTLLPAVGVLIMHLQPGVLIGEQVIYQAVGVTRKYNPAGTDNISKISVWYYRCRVGQYS